MLLHSSASRSALGSWILRQAIGTAASAAGPLGAHAIIMETLAGIVGSNGGAAAH